MTAERIFPNYRKVYYYVEGAKYISYRLFGEGCTKALQFMFFDSSKEAEKCFMDNLL